MTEAGTFWEIADERCSPAWLAKRALAAELRAVIALAVTTDAPASVLETARAHAAALRELLSQHPGVTFGDAAPGLTYAGDHLSFLDRNGIVGRSSPVSPPIALGAEGELSIGTVTFGPPFEGAPGCVHGGFVAAGFDQLFGHVQMRRGVPSMTGSLTVRYRKPTPIQKPLRYEARLSRASGRKHFVEGRLMDGETLLADAEALFVELAESAARRESAPT